MKAAVCRAFKAPLTIEDVSLADPLADEMEVQIKACAVCHSDIAYADGLWGGEMPQVLGHEAAGIVTRIGEQVSEFAVGDRVCVTLLRSCGQCRSCNRGHRSECSQPWDTEYSPITDAQGDRIVRGLKTGGFAEAVVVNPSQCAKIPDGVEFDVASLVSCGVITGAGAVVNTAKVRPGDTVAVIGAGGVGLNTIQMAAISGASKVIAMDVLDEKLAVAREFGATDGVLVGPDAEAEVRRLTEGEGVDFAFVTVGAPKAFEDAPALLAKGGAMVLVGMPPVGAECRPMSRLILADASLAVFGLLDGANQRGAGHSLALSSLYSTGSFEGSTS